MSSFPDVNVWLAIASSRHVHHRSAKRWFDGVDSTNSIYFCRITQLGFMRTLSTSAVMGEEVCTQRECWAIYDRFLSDERVHFLGEMNEMTSNLRVTSDRDEVSPKRWSDDYLLAFAAAHDLDIVTFDRAFAARSKRTKLLTAQP